MLALSVGLIGCGDDEEEATPTPAATATPAPATATPPPAKPTITLSDLNWGSAHFGTQVAKLIIEEGYGYPVELQSGATIALFTATRSGDVDVFIEGWLQNQQAAYDEAMAAGDIELLSFMNDDNFQSLFVVPTYVIEGDAERGIDPMAPDLASIDDLPDYIDLFADPEAPGKGRIVTCVPGWECEIINAAQLVAYGLEDDYNVLSPGSQEALFASLTGAYDKGEAWLGYTWGPTWLSGKLDLTQLEEPPYDPAVWEENRGCAYPAVDLFVASHIDFRDKAPEVAEMFENWVMDTATLAEALAFMQETEGEAVDAAIWFIKNREDVWTTFVPADVAQKVRDAVADM
jgi:glycine betaine/proline transport system substrate-binding protein